MFDASISPISVVIVVLILYLEMRIIKSHYRLELMTFLMIVFVVLVAILSNIFPNL